MPMLVIWGHHCVNDSVDVVIPGQIAWRTFGLGLGMLCLIIASLLPRPLPISHHPQWVYLFFFNY